MNKKQVAVRNIKDDKQITLIHNINQEKIKREKNKQKPWGE